MSWFLPKFAGLALIGLAVSCGSSGGKTVFRPPSKSEDAQSTPVNHVKKADGPSVTLEPGRQIETPKPDDKPSGESNPDTTNSDSGSNPNSDGGSNNSDAGGGTDNDAGGNSSDSADSVTKTYSVRCSISLFSVRTGNVAGGHWETAKGATLDAAKATAKKNGLGICEFERRRHLFASVLACRVNVCIEN